MIYDFRMFFCVWVCVLLLSVPRRRGGRWGQRCRGREGYGEGVLLWGVRFSFVGKLLKPFAFAFALMCVCQCVWLHVCVCVYTSVCFSECVYVLVRVCVC